MSAAVNVARHLSADEAAQYVAAACRARGRTWGHDGLQRLAGEAPEGHGGPGALTGRVTPSGLLPLDFVPGDGARVYARAAE